LPDEKKPGGPTWKEHARREKERLARELDGASGGGGGEGAEDRTLPPPDFMVFVTGLATQALVAMGAAPDPFTGEVNVRLDVARYHIDLIAVLEEKTRGNLTREEAAAMRAVLSDLRMQFVAVSEGRPADRGEAEPDQGDRDDQAGPPKPGKIILPT